MKKIESQTYRIGQYVVFKTAHNEWKMGQPIDWIEPVGAGLIAGTVTHHDTLREAKNRLYRERRNLKRGTSRQEQGD